MNTYSEYVLFIKENGRSMIEVESIPDEFALPVDAALYAVDMLYNMRISILGGDILSDKEDGTLVYAYPYWGKKYFTLNWSCSSGHEN